MYHNQILILCTYILLVDRDISLVIFSEVLCIITALPQGELLL